MADQTLIVNIVIMCKDVPFVDLYSHSQKLQTCDVTHRNYNLEDLLSSPTVGYPKQVNLSGTMTSWWFEPL